MPKPTDERCITATNVYQIAEWCNADVAYSNLDERAFITIRSTDEDLTAHIGDWVVKSRQGRFEVRSRN